MQNGWKNEKVSVWITNSIKVQTPPPLGGSPWSYGYSALTAIGRSAVQIWPILFQWLRYSKICRFSLTSQWKSRKKNLTRLELGPNG